MNVFYLDIQRVKQIHIFVMKQYGAGEQAGVKDENLLDSAVNRPMQSVFGEDAYPTLFDKAAALFHSLARNHCFYNGNNRTAFTATDTFLKKNGYKISVNTQTGEEFTLKVAQGQIETSEMANWFKQNCVSYE
ncbi:type II toxin-antitoxin system death-on-curing family toxin [Terrihalobacillus insolitus]|uniref:type II toxin-antitoxin system death-on-curing family toxin n=1 Tax=Terrihalobacillus insolitus TaxID=2950438 RepID=UPI0023424140|nr:type II toxin-antitoxin system death-on-curing family toxin [Terrihalobacillus insolitus]MDC3412872.1 type II toxin-antitoxin system death-on-curing family toxin [Terrihalobacillus insolitus]